MTAPRNPRPATAPDLPEFHGRPIDTPTGHRWAGYTAPASRVEVPAVDLRPGDLIQTPYGVEAVVTVRGPIPGVTQLVRVLTDTLDAVTRQGHLWTVVGPRPPAVPEAPYDFDAYGPDHRMPGLFAR